MTFTQVAAAYRTTSPRTVALVALAATFLCAFYLIRLTYLTTTTNWTVDYVTHAQPSPSTLTEDVFNRTLGVSFVLNISSQ
jgi:hypothetical protein